MSKEVKKDFRKTLNFLLATYYYHKEAIFIHDVLQKGQVPENYAKIDPIDLDDLMAGIKTLIKDGYIEHIYPEFSSMPFAAITGEGRVFFEKGAYKDNTTKLDKMITYTKNHPVISWVMIVFIALAGISSIAGFILQLIKFLTEQN